MSNAAWARRSTAAVWHPCSQMKDYEALPPIPIARAEGVWLEDVDGKREIGQKIMANRGLTPHRNKEAKNPRVRLRGTFGRAVTRRKGSVRDVKEKTDGYGGELTGVKTSVIKSRKFN